MEFNWTVYIILPVGGGITTLILARLVYFKCKSCTKIARENHKNTILHVKSGRGPPEHIDLKPIVPYSRPILPKIPKCERISVHVDPL